MNELNRVKGEHYFSTLDLAVIALFSALQFVLQFFTGKITFIPGAERPIVAFPVAFMATATYLRTKKVGAVGTTTIITGLLMLLLSGFPPVIFEWTGATLGFELVLITAHLLKREVGTKTLALASALLMLGRGVGVTIGLLIFVPVAVLHQVATMTLLLVYIAFNGVIPPFIAVFGAYAAARVFRELGLERRLARP